MSRQLTDEQKTYALALMTGHSGEMSPKGSNIWSAPEVAGHPLMLKSNGKQYNVETFRRLRSRKEELVPDLEKPTSADLDHEIVLKLERRVLSELSKKDFSGLTVPELMTSLSKLSSITNTRRKMMLEDGKTARGVEMAEDITRNALRSVMERVDKEIKAGNNIRPPERSGSK